MTPKQLAALRRIFGDDSEGVMTDLVSGRLTRSLLIDPTPAVIGLASGGNWVSAMFCQSLLNTIIFVAAGCFCAAVALTRTL